MERVNLRDMIFDSARRSASLAPKDMQETETAPNMKETGDFANTPFQGGDAFEREEPPKDHMRRYWRQYETTPIVREPINSFAQQVVEPGYRIESEHLSDDEIKELNKWLRKAAILEKEPDKDIIHMLKKAVVQREVRGTALIEKVYAEEDEEALYGLAFMNAETVRPNTRPGTPLLLLPDDEGRIEADGELPETEQGEIAAYTQYTTASGFGEKDPNSDDVNNYSIHDVVKLTRDADVNEAFGTSRLESCSETIEGIKQKLSDQNEAIASKAYPLWLFLFGTEDRPWDRQDIQRFMQAHDMENFHPGLKQGVRGDVDIQTISGEVADIADQLEFELDYIISSMPLPKYSLGAFDTSINPQVAQTQERTANRQIKEARRELEAEFSEVVQQKARELFGIGGGEDAKDEEIYFKIGRPGEEYIEDNPQVNTINYNGKDDDQDQQFTDPSQPGQPPDSGAAPVPSGGGGGSEEGSDTVWDADLDEIEELSPQTDGGVACADAACGPDVGEHTTAELADPRLVGTRDIEADMADLITRVFTTFRETLLQRLAREYSGTPHAAAHAFEDMAHSQLNRVIRQYEFSDEAEVLMRAAVARTLTTLGQDNQSVTLDIEFGYRHRRMASDHASQTQDATRDALESLIARMNAQLRRMADNGEEMAVIRERLANTYSDGILERRAGLIARMETQNATESTKLQEFEASPEVAGVRVINPCTHNTTRLCRDLGGCDGTAATANFDGASLSQQWQEQADGSLLIEGFDPLPDAPPFHWNCRSALIAVSDDELSEALAERPATSVEDLEAKYDMDLSDI